MKKVERYILENIISPFIFCLILILSLYIIIDFSTKLDHIIKNKVGLEIITEYYLYFLPRIIYQIIPLCLLVATIYSLTKMNKFNELIAMRSSGISFFIILKPYFALTFLLIAFMFWDQEVVIPISYQNSKKIECFFEGKGENKIYNNVTFYAQGNRIIFAKAFYPEENILDDIVILEQNLDKKVLYKIRAESAHYIKGKWILYNLIIYKLGAGGTEVEETVALSKKEYDLKENPKELLAYQTDITYQSFKSLIKKLIKFGGISEEVVRRIAIEIYHKISFPFTNLVLLLLGLYIGLKSRQASLLKGLGVALLIGFSYYTLDAFAYSLGKIGFLPPFLGAFFANISFLVLGIYLLTKTFSH